MAVVVELREQHSCSLASGAQAKVHFLDIPKKHILSAAALTEEDGALLGHVFAVIAKLAKEQGLDNGYRVISNVGEDAGQRCV